MLDFYWGNCFLIIHFQFILMVSQRAVSGGFFAPKDAEFY